MNNECGKVAVVCMIKRETDILDEFIQHHLNIGFDNIILLTNDDPKDLPALRVQVEPYGDKVILDDYWVGSTDKNRQWNAYQKAYTDYGKDYDWMFFHDCDEHLVLKKHKDIKEFLSSDPYYKANMIHVCWTVYGDNGHVHRTEGTLEERFPIPLPDETKSIYPRILLNDHVKTGLRTGMQIWWRHPHTALVQRAKCVTGSGNEGHMASPFERDDRSVIELRHYLYRSTEEYCTRRFLRLQGCDGVKEDIQRDINNYFRDNECTKEKVEFIERFLADHNLSC